MCSVAALLGGEDPQLALRAVDRLLVGAVRVRERDLPVVRAVRDEERDGDLLDDAVEVDAVGEGDERVEVVVTPHPEHVFPVVRDRALALALEPAALDRAPVVVGAPGDGQREALLERGGPGGVVAAERPADDADAVGVDVRAALQVVDARGRPTPRCRSGR